jgi:osmotically-inducible protein OsmY
MIKKLTKFCLCATLLSVGVLMPSAMRAAQSTQQAPTADQAKNDKADRELARKIRRDVVKDKSLSTYGHNVKIIAENGKVTLRGPIHSEDERKAILTVAQKYAGDGNVVDELTIKGDNQ